MHILLANLGQLYRRRSLLLVYGVTGAITYAILYDALLDSGGRKGGFAALLIPVFLLGLVAAVMQMEITSKAFSFCLPGYRGAFRNLMLVIGLGVSFLFSLPFVGYPGLFAMSAARAALALCSAFCANLMAYMAAVGIGVALRNAIALAGFLPLVVIVARIGRLNGAIESTVVHSPVAVIAVAAIMALCGWRWLGHAAWFRRHSAVLRVGLFDAWDRSRMHKYHEAFASRRFAGVDWPTLDRFFLGRIRSRDHRGAGTYAWGALYPTALLIAPQWKGLLFVVLLALFAGSYVPDAVLIVAVIPAMAAGYIHPPVHSKLLVAGGRAERFTATIIVLLVLTMAVLVMTGLVVLLSNALTPVMPEIDMGRMHWTFEAIRATTLLLPALIVPIVGLMQILFYRKPVLHAVSFMVAGMFAMTVYYVWRMSPSAPLLYIVGGLATLLAWIICLLGARQKALHGDLTA